MAEQQVPGGPFVNETASNQQQIPGGPFINETASTSTFLAAWARNATVTIVSDNEGLE